MSFENFKNAINNQFDRLISSGKLFYVEADKDKLWDIYLSTFPEGSDKLFRERTTHDCQYCKQFVRNAGNVVAIINGKIETIWDIVNEGVDDCYQIVAKNLANKVGSSKIAGIYLHFEKILGRTTNEQTYYNEELGKDIINVFDHFHYVLPAQFVCTYNIDKIRGEARTNKEVLERGMTEINLEVAETVLDLIDENHLPRGKEKEHVVKKFVEFRKEYDTVPDTDIFLWLKSTESSEVSRLKNTSIGTLLVDLSEGIPLDIALKKYDDKVASLNYKRRSAPVTQKQLNKLQDKLEELGLGKSIERIFANESHIHQNNVIFANKTTKKKMKKGKKKKGLLADIEPTKTNFNSKKAEEIDIEKFISRVAPYAEDMEIMVMNNQINNLMNLVAPKHPKAERLHYYHNAFSWNYNGEVTDSIRERIKNAGGNVEGDARVSLKWFNYDDLDLHVIEPDNTHIYFSHKRSHQTGGFLDVDKNAGSGTTRKPAENIAWEDEKIMKEGTYKFFVHQYAKRENVDIGFEAEVVIGDKTYQFGHDKALRQGEKVTIMEFTYSRTNGIIVNDDVTLPSPTASKTVWGIETHKWTKVNMLMLSPNFWDGERSGNKHWFFILEGCINPDKSRGFYNEFLRYDLKEHAKALELLSSKLKTPHTDKQLSGLGFSSTLPNTLLCKVTGKYSKVYEIVFAPDQGNRFENGFLPKGVMFEKPKVVCKCEICKGDIMSTDVSVKCPECDQMFHSSHFIEWVRVGGTCPVCRESITQPQVDKIRQLIIV